MKMKYLVLGALFVGASAQASVILSNPASIPGSNVAIEQSDHSGAANQIRNRGATDIRFITETFVWNTDDAFDGIGFYLDGGNNSYWTAGDSQNYTFAIQELNDGLGLPPTQTMYNETFSLAGSYVADGQWLYLDTDNVALQNGSTYGFALSAASTDTALLRTFVTTASSDAYSAGLARITGDDWGETGALKTAAYNTGSGVNDHTFYMQSIPEPATIGLLGLCATGMLFVRRVFMV